MVFESFIALQPQNLEFDRNIGGIAIADLVKARMSDQLTQTTGKISGEPLQMRVRPGYYCIYLSTNPSIHFKANLQQRRSSLKLADFNYASVLPDGKRHPDFRTHDLVKHTLTDFQQEFGRVDGVTFRWEESSTSNFKPYISERDRLFILFSQLGLPEDVTLKRAQEQAALTATWDGKTFGSEEFGFTYLTNLREENRYKSKTITGCFLREDLRLSFDRELTIKKI